MNNLRKNSSIVWILCKKGENAGGNLMTTRFRPIYINRYGTLLHHHLLSVDDIHAFGHILGLYYLLWLVSFSVFIIWLHRP